MAVEFFTRMLNFLHVLIKVFKVGRGFWSGSSSIRFMNMRSRVSGGRFTRVVDVGDILLGSLLIEIPWITVERLEVEPGKGIRVSGSCKCNAQMRFTNAFSHLPALIITFVVHFDVKSIESEADVPFKSNSDCISD